MSDGYIQHRISGRISGREARCEFERTLRGEHCSETSEIELDGLRVCERHADRLRLEERVAYWRAILAHVELWSGEAHRRGRRDVVGLLEVEWARASAALERASAELQRNRDGKSPDGSDGKDPPLW